MTPALASPTGAERRAFLMSPEEVGKWLAAHGGPAGGEGPDANGRIGQRAADGSYLVQQRGTDGAYQVVETHEAGGGLSAVGDSLSGEMVGVKGQPIPLTPAEQKRLDQLRGEAFRVELERTNAGTSDYRAATLEGLRSDALDKAKTKLLGEIGVAEARKRAMAQPVGAR